MYKHLLVALDDSPLGAHTVGRAVAFAQAAGARISFFHATPDLAAPGDSALLYSLDTTFFSETASGNTNSVLLKAATAAGLAGVPCQTLAVTSEHPAQALLDAAHAQRCDLIFVSSHGRLPGLRGWLHGSVTKRLLQITDLPVLVCTVEANSPTSACDTALAIVAGEHRAIASVLQGLQQLLCAARAEGGVLDVALMRQMLAYLRAFPEGQHHPKEEAHLFRLLRLRTDTLGPELEELLRQHVQEQVLVENLALALEHYTPAEAATLEAVGAAVHQLAGAVWEHMSMEETTIFPAARRHLDDNDWDEVARAFRAHQDPLLNFDSDINLPVGQLYNRIAAALLASGQPGG